MTRWVTSGSSFGRQFIPRVRSASAAQTRYRAPKRPDLAGVGWQGGGLALGAGVVGFGD
jgi:hypothetical protein